MGNMSIGRLEKTQTSKTYVHFVWGPFWSKFCFFILWGHYRHTSGRRREMKDHDFKEEYPLSLNEFFFLCERQEYEVWLVWPLVNNPLPTFPQRCPHYLPILFVMNSDMGITILHKRCHCYHQKTWIGCGGIGRERVA